MKQTIKGFGVSSGIRSGKAFVLDGTLNLSAIDKGDMLVCKMTAPDMVEHFDKLAGIICAEGGKTCHAAIVASQMDIPCVVGAGTSVFNIKHGDTVQLDGSTGEVVFGGSKEEMNNSAWDAGLARARSQGMQSSRERWASFGEDDGWL